MSATQDEIAWAMTFNILATAVVTPMTGWLVARFGAKRVMTLSRSPRCCAGSPNRSMRWWYGEYSRALPERPSCR